MNPAASLDAAVIGDILPQTLSQACAENGWPLINAGVFRTHDPVVPEEIIHGVLYRGGKMVYGGPSKAFKTWALQSLCVAVANGLPWLGMQTTEARALYINFELQDFSVHRRFKWIAEAHGSAHLGDVDILNLRGHDAPLETLAEVIGRTSKGDYGLIVPDPIYKALHGKDENSAGDIAAICAQIDALAKQSGAAVVYGAHFAKGNASGKQAEDRISGSGVFARDPDAIVTATPHATDGAYTIDMKLRDFPAKESFCVRWKCPLMLPTDDLDPQHLKQPARATYKTGGASVIVSDGDILAKVDKPITAGEFDRWLETLGMTGRRMRTVKADVLDGETGRGVLLTVKYGMPCKTYYCRPGQEEKLLKKLKKGVKHPELEMSEQGEGQ